MRTAPTIQNVADGKPDPLLRDPAVPLAQRAKNLAWLSALVYRAAPRHTAIWAIAGFVQGILAPLQIWAGGQVIGSIAQGPERGNTSSPWLWLWIIALSLVGGRFLDVGRSYSEAVVREQGAPAVQARIYEQATRIELSDFEHQGFYDSVARITTEIETQAASIMRELQGSFLSVPRLIGALILVFGIDWRIGVIALLPLIPNVVNFFRSGDAMWTMLSDQTRDRRLAAYYADTMTDRQAAKEIRLFELQSHLLERWSHHYLATRDELRRKRFWLSMRTFSLTATTSASTLAGLIWLLFGVELRLTPQEITILMSSFLILPNWVFDVAGQAMALGQFSGIASDTRAFAERSAPFAIAASPRDAAVSPAVPVSEPGTLIARNLRYTYPGSIQSTIADISLDIPSGQRVAIVGENGAGKTTLIKLLLGLYPPDSGSVELDGTRINDIPVAERQHRLSAVFQQFTRYPLTLEENIQLGNVTGDDSRQVMKAVLTMAGMSEFVSSQSEGTKTLLSPELGGVDISGGQWQRLAIARAGYRRADVLALDEPTAALDPMAEVEIYRRFAQLAASRTTLLVSHRLGMTRLADRIIVIEHGCVVEDGTHDRLVAENGRYARMWMAQARWYV